MKKFGLCLLLALVYTASAVPLDGGDVPLTLDEEQIDVELLERVNRDADEINEYLLYTRSNQETAQELFMNDAESIRASNFNPQHNTVVIAHGWLSNQDTGLNSAIRDAYLTKGDANVIVLDWRKLARSNYISAANGVPAVGRALGQFVGFLSSVSGASLKTFHLVGFSLGAHLVGNAGRELDGQVARVTGLDPAGPLWNFNRNRLGPNDAIYVEAIHTDGGDHIDGLGIGRNIAQVDFYPNGGSSQSGCWGSHICSHNRAWRLFAATVTYDHLVGRECSNYIQLTLGTCRGQNLNMGNDDLNKTGSGMYRVSTGRRYPY